MFNSRTQRRCRLAQVEAETVEQVEQVLRRVCKHEKCIGRDAMLEIAKRLCPETAAWIVKKDGDRMQLFAIKDAAVHEVSAECNAPEDKNLDDPETSECRYEVLRRLTGAETFTCRIERTERRDRPPKTRTSWSFNLHVEDPFEIAYTADEAEALREDSFAQALVKGILVAP